MKESVCHRSAQNNHDSRPKASLVYYNVCNNVCLLSLVFYEISSMRRPPIFKYILPGRSFCSGFLNLIHLIIRWADELLNRSVKVIKVPGAESPGKKLHHRKIISLQTSPFECLRDPECIFLVTHRENHEPLHPPHLIQLSSFQCF